MNDQQTQMMINQAQHIMNQAPPPPQVMNQQPPPLPQLPVQSQPMMMLNRSYNTNINNNNNNSSINNNNKPWPGKIGNFGSSKPRTNNNNNNNNNNNWKGKKITIDKRRIDNQIANAVYNPPTLHELQSQNRQKTRKFYSNKKKFNNNNNNRFAPYAPRNTTSFIIRAKKAGGIASLVSPCPVTPAVLPTPIFSPSREVLGDMAKEEWGVDGYGSMKGLIRLRSGNDHDEEDDDEGNGSSESDVEEHVEVERRLDHDLSRFEMIYPNYSNNIGGLDYNNVLENRVDDQDSHISQLEEENLTLKERLFLMERELGDLRRRMQFLERQNSNQHQSCLGVEDVHEEVVENGSENESENGSDVREHREENNEDVCMQASGVPVKKEEEIVRNEFGDDSVYAERDDRRNIEEVDNQVVAEVKSEDEQKEAVNEIIENKVNLVAEKEESKDEHMCVEKSIDGVDKL